MAFGVDQNTPCLGSGLGVSEDGARLDCFALRRVQVIHFEVQVHLLRDLRAGPGGPLMMVDLVNREPDRTSIERDEVIRSACDLPARQLLVERAEPARVGSIDPY